MKTNLIYLAAATVAIIAVARLAAPAAILASAFAIVGVISVTATLAHGPSAIVDILGALAGLLHSSRGG